MANKGLAIYFFDDRICIFEKTMEELNYPKYIHLFINKKEKLLFIRGSDSRDNDTFRVSRKKENEQWRYRICCKGFVKYLAFLIGVPYPSDSLWFEGTLLEDRKTVKIELSKYHITPYLND